MSTTEIRPPVYGLTVSILQEGRGGTVFDALTKAYIISITIEI